MKNWSYYYQYKFCFVHDSDERAISEDVDQKGQQMQLTGIVLSVCKQVAQLSQRDRAAWWVSNGQKWKTGTERQYLRTIGLYSTTATYLASKEIEIGEKTQNKGCYAV